MELRLQVLQMKHGHVFLTSDSLDVDIASLRGNRTDAFYSCKRVWYTIRSFVIRAEREGNVTQSLLGEDFQLQVWCGWKGENIELENKSILSSAPQGLPES